MNRIAVGVIPLAISVACYWALSLAAEGDTRRDHKPDGVTVKQAENPFGAYEFLIGEWDVKSEIDGNPIGGTARPLGSEPFLYLVRRGSALGWTGGTAPGRYVGVERRAQKSRHAFCHGSEVRTSAGAGNNVGGGRWKFGSQYHGGLFTGRSGDDRACRISRRDGAVSANV